MITDLTVQHQESQMGDGLDGVREILPHLQYMLQVQG